MKQQIMSMVLVASLLTGCTQTAPEERRFVCNIYEVDSIQSFAVNSTEAKECRHQGGIVRFVDIP